MTQSDTIAQIATTMTDKPVPTAAEILAALNRAYESGERAGFQRGFEACNKGRAQFDEILHERLGL